MSAPRWLQDEPEIKALLHAALDRFDQQAADARRRPTWLAAERYLPTLARTDAAADQLWRFVNELAEQGVLSVRSARRNVYDAEWRGAKLGFAEQSETTLRDWLQRPKSLPPMEAWCAAVQTHATLFADGIAPLLERRIVVPGRGADDVVRALATLGGVKVPATLRQLSAFAFWGDSKVLDDRADLIAALFPRLVIRERPVVVSIHLPEPMTGVLFIENQDTYTAAIGGEPPEVAGAALVYLAGFKATAERIRERSGVSLHFAGSLDKSKDFVEWWFDDSASRVPAWFWGDLDFAGMQMLKSLRQRFGDVRAWQPGYAPMLHALATHGGRVAATDSLQSDPITTGCDYADSVLLPAIRRFGFWDQERLRDGNE